MVTTATPLLLSITTTKKLTSSDECISCLVQPDKCDESLYPNLEDAVYHSGSCVAECPNGFYSLMNRGECLPSCPSWYYTLDQDCFMECPAGYYPNTAT